jgi:hypothetical protein
MRTALVALSMIVGPVAAFVIVVMLPRWFPRRMHGHRMWRLRDSIVDDIIQGGLPNDHPAVRQLVQQVEASLRMKRLTLLDLYIFRWACMGIDASMQAEMRRGSVPCSSKGLTAEQTERVRAYRESFEVLMVGWLLLGSWFGLLHVVRFFPRALSQGDPVQTQGRPLRRIEVGVTSSARDATDMAAKGTRLGRKIGDLVARKRGLLTPEWAGESRFDRELVAL